MAAGVVALPVLAYRYLFSPLIGPRCRYLPTCSEYAIEALGRHGAIRGGALAARRFCRCHPWGGHGLDAVPETLPASGGRTPQHPERKTASA